ELIRSLDGPAVTMIAGAPGVGKTLALQHFVATEGHDALYASVAQGEGKPFCIAVSLLRLFWDDVRGMSLAHARGRLAGYIGKGRVLVVDEAQYLTAEGAEWLRALAETAGCDLVLCGD